MFRERIMTGLGKFIAEEIRRRQMSDREFARFVGVSSSTISRTLSEEAPKPTIEFLEKLSKATNVSVGSLLALILPESHADIDPEARILAERIANLPEDKRAIAETFLMGILLKAED